jgi:hypothetical protein
MGHLTTRSAELMSEHTHKPVPVMAVQVTDANADKVRAMLNGKLYQGTASQGLRIYFHCCNGRQSVGWGDWVLKDARGFRAMSQKEFTETYDKKESA